MMKKYCFNCGAQINASTKFCPRCGTKQINKADNHVDANDIVSNDYEQSNTRQNVSMGQAFKLFWKNYFNFTGISKRSEYWFWILWNFIITFIVEFVSGFGQGYGSSGLTTMANEIMLIYALSSFIPNISLTIRRMRDTKVNNIISIILLIASIILILIGIIYPIAYFIDLILVGSIIIITLLPSKE